jgi:hypothetical protein
MIITALRKAENQGLSRSEIIAAVNRDYGVKMPANTATTTLLRMQNAGLASKHRILWYLREEALET